MNAIHNKLNRFFFACYNNLEVYLILYVLPLNLLFGVLLLLEFKDVFVKVELELLVSVVDAQLLEAVLL